MKKLITILAMVFTVVAFAQVPDKMSYQTVVRNSDGLLVKDSNISIQISILKGGQGGAAVYTEVHKTTTNANGLASLIIGNGIVSSGSYEAVDWINGPYFIETSTDPEGGSNFEIVGVSELLSVPYAISARTAENVFSGNYQDLENRPVNLSDFINDLGFVSQNSSNGKAVEKGVPSQNWSLFGNSKSDPLKDKLGTTDYTDLVLVTDNLDRFRIKANGDIDIAKSLKIGENLTVNQNVDLNTLGGATVNNGNFTVENSSSTSLTGTLTVDGVTNLNSTLDVNNSSPTNLTGTLNVDKATTLQSTLDVRNAAPTNLTGTLNVDGSTTLQSTLDVENASATNLTGTLNVDKGTTLQSALDVKNAAPTNLTGTLNVNGATRLQNTLNVENAAATNLTGTLNVIEATTLQSTLLVNNSAAADLTGDLTVDGVTNLNGSLDVNNGVPTTLTGDLTVDGATNLNSSLDVNNAAPVKLTGALTVDGITNLNNTLNVTNAAATNLSGTLNVEGETNFNSSLNTKGQVTIDANVNGGEGSYNAYPLRVQGSDQGIAIKLNSGIPNSNNNFVTFFNSHGGAVGRIEGQTPSEVASDPEFIYNETMLLAEEGVAIANVALSLVPVIVAGFGASGGPCTPCITIEAANLVLATANVIAYNVFAHENLGVTYQSGSADYAEWMERFNPSENITAGDIVGVTSGKISKYTANSQQYMVISTKPAILGNMPQKGQEYLYEKVAFMGQIPVKVKGMVVAGDYILPSGLNDGIGIAVSPEEIAAEQYQKIVGVAWSNSFMNKGVSMVNMAIGLNSNDVAALAVKQEKRISELEMKFASLEQKISALEGGTEYSPKKISTKDNKTVAATANQEELTRYDIIASNMPSELNDAILKDAMAYLKEQYQQKNIDIEKHAGLNKLFNDQAYQQEVFRKTKQNYRKAYQQILKTAGN